LCEVSAIIFGNQSNSSEFYNALIDTDGDGIGDNEDTDDDNDGISDNDEINVHGTNPKLADSDRDGFLDGFELKMRKSPINPLEYPALAGEVIIAIEFSFPSALGKTYRIEDSIDMISWNSLESGIIGNGEMTTRFYTKRNKANRFFKVVEEIQP